MPIFPGESPVGAARAGVRGLRLRERARTPIPGNDETISHWASSWRKQLAPTLWATDVGTAGALSLTHDAFTVDVERIIIGGGLSWYRAGASVPRATFRDAPEIVRASLGEWAGVGEPRSWPPPGGRIDLL